MSSKGQVTASMDQYKRSMLGQTEQQLLVCRIDKINSDMTVDVTVMSGATGVKLIHRVKVTSPYRNNENGIVVMPEIGCLAIVAVISDIHQFVISYLNYSDSNVESISTMKEGEYLIKSKQGSYMKFNDNQSLDMHSGGNSALFIDNDRISEVTESKTSINVASEINSGILNGVVQGVEKWYDKDIETDLSNEDIVEAMSSLGECYVELNERKPILEIQKGNVVNATDKRVKLALFEDPAENPDACYMLNVSSGDSDFSILIGKDGSAQIKGNILKVECNELDLSMSQNIGYSSLNFIEKE